MLQCERKEEFIDKIQDLDFDTKASVAAHIQEVSSRTFMLVTLFLCTSVQTFILKHLMEVRASGFRRH